MENEFPRGQLNPTILSTMANGDKYGYEIIEEIKQKTGIEIKQPSLYSSLKRMETQKLVSSYWKDSAIGGKRHYYCITNDGREFLKNNPVDFSIYNVAKKEEQPVLQPVVETAIFEQPQINTPEIKEEIAPSPTFNGVVLNTAKPVIVETKEEIASPVEKEFISQQPVEETTFLKQENLFSIAKIQAEQQIQQNFEKEIKEANIEVEEENLQYDLFNEVDLAADDGRFITETLEDYNIPKIGRFEPATLNIEQRDTSYLNAKIKPKERQEQKREQAYQEKISDMMVKKEVPFDHEKSIAKINQKIDQFEAEKRKQKDELLPPKKPEQQAPKQTVYAKNENVYVREKPVSKIFNSYKSLETYYRSKGIGFNAFVAKDKSSTNYVNPALVRLVRGTIFFVFSLILAIAFYCGIKANSIGKIIYIITPSLSLGLVAIYGYLFRKSNKRKLVQIKKDHSSQIVLPLISIALILLIIGINLIIGFRAPTTMKFFPVLIYPIILSFHLMILNPLNRLIESVIKKLRNKYKYKK